MISIPFKKFKITYFIKFILSCGQDVLSHPNELDATPHYLMRSVWSWPDILAPALLSITCRKLSPNPPMTDFPIPCHDPPFFETFISKAPPGGTILSMCARFTNYEVHNDVLYTLPILLKISSRLFERIQQVGFLFLLKCLICFNLKLFLIPNISMTNTNCICPRYTGEATRHLSGPS